MVKKRLLIVEDDHDVAEMLTAYLSSEGYDVHHAPWGEDGINMARAKFPNLILLDVMLPDIDGFEVARSLRTTALTRHIPIMFLTQRDRRNDKITGLELGADDYIGKPFDLRELLVRIQGSLHRSTREHLYDPNTGLPLKAIIDEDKAQVIKNPACIAFDLQIAHLRSFRDVYGFVAAGYLLNFFGLTVTETLAKYGTKDDLAGMYGEDRYVIFTLSDKAEALCHALKGRFDDGAQAFYNFLDRERGYLVLYDEALMMRRIPLMSLTIARAVPLKAAVG
jgi:DNA-binding response OmpR family regulator